ncbi:type II 3-dehydroquinate dehydratase [Candidatus Vidania fulgoroideorum]
MIKVDVINGPNMNVLGKRQKKLYGTASLKDIFRSIKYCFYSTNLKIRFFQSNSESNIVSFIQNSNADYFVINMAAFSYIGYSILDSLFYKRKPFIEVHITNIFSREKFRVNSIFTKYSIGIISGFGHLVYYLAIIYILNLYA